MLNTFVVYVEDKPGVLARVAILFRRRAFNIETLTVGRTEQKGISRMTIVVDTDERGARRLEANLYKLVNVLWVGNVTTSCICRDLALIKVGINPETRSQVLDIARLRGAQLREFGPRAVIFEITAQENEIDALLEALRPYPVLEMVRTGRIAMTRGDSASVPEVAVQRSLENHSLDRAYEASWSG
jgi:acetolactate synthase-1/3 small subunit